MKTTVKPTGNISLMLGKAPAEADSRNLKFAALLNAAALPTAYDFDTAHPGIPTPMFNNDVLGNCVIAGRAHQTLRFEMIEQNRLLNITDKDVNDQYMKETRGSNTGLVVLKSLKSWRSDGWKISNTTYKIQAFAEINPLNRDEVRQAIFSDVGVGIGVLLPTSAHDQFTLGMPWTIIPDGLNLPGSWGGHYAYVSGYTPEGPLCVTWGKRYHMSWEWFEKYCDEAYAIFDAKNSFKKSMIKTDVLSTFLSDQEI